MKKIAIFLVLCILQGCMVTNSSIKISDGISILYKPNRLLITVMDGDGNKLENSKVAVVGKSNRISFGLIKEISDSPLKTDNQGKVTLTADGGWGVGYASKSECIYYNAKEYCHNIYSTPVEYNETVVVELEGYDTFKVNYEELINCKVTNARCYSKEKATGELEYIVEYTIRLIG